MNTKKKTKQITPQKLDSYTQLSNYAKTIDGLEHALSSQRVDPNIIFNELKSIIGSLQQSPTLFADIRTLTINSEIEHTPQAPLIPFLLGGIVNIYNKFYRTYDNYAFFICKDLAQEVMNIAQSSLFKKHLTIEAYCDILTLASHYFKISCIQDSLTENASNIPQEIRAMCVPPLSNKTNFIQQLNNIFEEILKLLVLEEKTSVSSARKAVLTDLKLTAYSATILNRRVMYLFEPKQLSSLIDIFQNTSHLLLGKDIYNAMLELMIQTEKPNINVIAQCFKQLQKHALIEQSFIAAHHFEKLWTALNKWGIHHVKKPTSIEHDQLQILFDIAQESIKSNLIPQGDHWFTLLSIFYAHKKQLSENQFEKIYEYAYALLKIDNMFNYKEIINDKERYLFEVFLLLLSFAPNIELTQINELYLNFKEKNPDLINQSLHELIATILSKTKNFSFNDFESLFLQCTNENNDKTVRLLGHLFKEYQDTSTDFVRFCTQHLTTIMANKNLFSLFLRRIDATLITKFSAPEIQHEYNNALEVEQLKEQFQVKWSNTAATQQMQRIINKSLNTINVLCIRNILPSEKKFQLEELDSELSALYEVDTLAEQKDIKINSFKSKFLKDLEQTPIPLAALKNHRLKYEQAIQTEEERRKEAKKYTLSVQEAQRLVTKGELNELERINICLLIQPKNIEAHLIKIKCLVKLGYFDEALVWLAKTKTAFPGQENESLLQSWATCCKALGQHADALEAYQQLLHTAKKSQCYSIQLSIAQCYQSMGKEEHFDNAFAIYDQLLQTRLSPERQTRVISAQIACLMKQNRFAEAQTLLSAHFANQHNAPFYALSASLYFQQGDFTQAATNYERAFCMQNNIRWLSKLLECYQSSKNIMSDKKDMLMNALARTTTETHETLCLKVSIYMRLNDYKNARDTLKIINDKWGKSYCTYVQEALCLRAEHHFTKAIDLLHDFPNYQQNKTILKHLATTYAMAGMHEQALKTYDDLLLEFPSYAQVYRKVIPYCLHINDIERAHFYWAQCQDYCGEHYDLLLFLEQRLGSSAEYCFINEQTTLDEEDHMITQINQHNAWVTEQQPTNVYYSQLGFYSLQHQQSVEQPIPSCSYNY